MIIATVRTRNEERNIGRFCEAYQTIADKIFVADGGSEDDTIEIAQSYPKVEVRPFEETFEAKDGSLLNPQGKHVNFLIEWAIEEGAEWIIFDDCDCVPNYLIREDARGILNSTKEPAIYAHRVYFWGFDMIFPDMHGGGTKALENARLTHKLGVPAWTSLWAWRRETFVQADEVDKWHLTMLSHLHGQAARMRQQARHLRFPYCLMHFSWQTPQLAKEKVDQYRSSGQQPTALYPEDFAGQPVERAPYMREHRNE